MSVTGNNITDSIEADSINITSADSTSLLVTSPQLSTSLLSVNGSETSATSSWWTSVSESAAVTQSTVVNESLTESSDLIASTASLTLPTMSVNNTDSVTTLPTTSATTTGWHLSAILSPTQLIRQSYSLSVSWASARRSQTIQTVNGT